MRDVLRLRVEQVVQDPVVVEDDGVGLGQAVSKSLSTQQIRHPATVSAREHAIPTQTSKTFLRNTLEPSEETVAQPEVAAGRTNNYEPSGVCRLLLTPGHAMPHTTQHSCLLLCYPYPTVYNNTSPMFATVIV